VPIPKNSIDAGIHRMAFVQMPRAADFSSRVGR